MTLIKLNVKQATFRCRRLIMEMPSMMKREGVSTRKTRDEQISLRRIWIILQGHNRVREQEKS